MSFQEKKHEYIPMTWPNIEASDLLTLPYITKLMTTQNGLYSQEKSIPEPITDAEKGVFYINYTW